MGKNSSDGLTFTKLLLSLSFTFALAVFGLRYDKHFTVYTLNSIFYDKVCVRASGLLAQLWFLFTLSPFYSLFSDSRIKSR